MDKKYKKVDNSNVNHSYKFNNTDQLQTESNNYKIKKSFKDKYNENNSNPINYHLNKTDVNVVNIFNNIPITIDRNQFGKEYTTNINDENYNNTKNNLSHKFDFKNLKMVREKFEEELKDKISNKASNCGFKPEKYLISICQNIDLDNHRTLNWKTFKKLIIDKLLMKTDEVLLSYIFINIVISNNHNMENIQINNNNNLNNYLLNYIDYSNDLFYSKKVIKEKVKDKEIVNKQKVKTINYERIHKSIKNSLNLIVLYYNFLISEINEINQTNSDSNKTFNENNNRFSLMEIHGLKVIEKIDLKRLKVCDDINVLDGILCIYEISLDIFNKIEGKVNLRSFMMCMSETFVNLKLSQQEIHNVFKIYDSNNSQIFDYNSFFKDIIVSF